MLKVKPFKQHTGFCGPASLKMVLGYYNIDISEKDLAQMTQCTKEQGVEAWKLLQVAQDLGLSGFVKDEATFDDVATYVLKKHVPVIVDWFSEDDGHYSVVVDIDQENIYLLDPAIGYVRAMRKEKFFRVWFDFPGNYILSKDDLSIRRIIVLYKDNDKTRS